MLYIIFIIKLSQIYCNLIVVSLYIIQFQQTFLLSSVQKSTPSSSQLEGQKTWFYLLPDYYRPNKE